MVRHDRRDVLKYTGFTIAGGLLTASAATADGDESSAADPSSLEEAGGWSSVGGNPGNNAVVPAADGLEPPVTVAWEYEHGGPVAVVDGTVYLPVDGELHALDAADGTLEWKTEDVGAAGTPAIAADTAFVGGERLTKVDAETGDVCCQADLADETAIPSPVVASGLVLVVADGVLYAIDAVDETEQWSFEPADDPLFEQPVAVADGAVFAASESELFALELEDGTERWTVDDPPVEQFDESHFSDEHHPVATDDVVAVGVEEEPNRTMYYQGTVPLYDTQTGELKTVSGPPITPGPITDDRYYLPDTGARRTSGFDRETGSQVWEPEEVEYNVRSPIVNDGTVYMGVQLDGMGYKPEDEPDVWHGVFAFDEKRGETQWAIEIEHGKPPALALADGTLYASADTLLAIRADSADEDDEADADEPDDTADGQESGEDTDGADENGEENESDEADASEADDEERDGDDAESADEATDADEDDATDDGTPGFTAAAGIGGGALALEWLRRKQSDESQ